MQGAKSIKAYLVAAVRTVLLEQRDPIGIRDVAHARDEYDAYALAIVGMLGRGADVEELSRYLLEIESDRMGLPTNPERARSVAAKLRSL